VRAHASTAREPSAAEDSGSPRGGVTGRAGRNLPAAIGVGVGLGAVVLAALFFDVRVFTGLVGAAVVIGIAEITTTLRTTHRPHLPVLAAAAAGAAVVIAAYGVGAAGLGMATGVLLTAGAAAAVVSGETSSVPWRLAHAGSVAYIAGCASCAVLLAVDRPAKVVLLLAVVAANDTAGYAVGVLAGRHRLAPRISPKKSWEGLGGSVAGGMLTAALLFATVLHRSWWQGVGFGAAVVAAATAGDLLESWVKRRLGVKDMGRLLPGHGGLLDRIDSILLAAPVAWALLGYLWP